MYAPGHGAAPGHLLRQAGLFGPVSSPHLVRRELEEVSSRRRRSHRQRKAARARIGRSTHRLDVSLARLIRGALLTRLPQRTNPRSNIDGGLGFACMMHAAIIAIARFRP